MIFLLRGVFVWLDHVLQKQILQVAHLEGWSSVFYASGHAEWCCRTPAHRWRGRRPLAVAPVGSASSADLLRSEPDPAGIEACSTAQMSSPQHGSAHGSPELLAVPPLYPYFCSDSQVNKKLFPVQQLECLWWYCRSWVLTCVRLVCLIRQAAKQKYLSLFLMTQWGFPK